MKKDDYLGKVVGCAVALGILAQILPSIVDIVDELRDKKVEQRYTPNIHTSQLLKWLENSNGGVL